MACQLVSLIHAQEEEKVAWNALEEEQAGRQRESLEGNLLGRREGASEEESGQVLVETPALAYFPWLMNGFFCVSADALKRTRLRASHTHACLWWVGGGGGESKRAQ